MSPGVINTEMLRECAPDSASGYPDAEAWSRVAVPFMLSVGTGDNGRSMTVPRS